MTPIMIILLAVLAVVLVVMVADSPIGRALAARLESRTDTLSDRRLAALEGEVDRLGREVQRLDDESAFLHRLLEEKRAPEALPPRDTTD
jgi:cell division protein FtsB